MHRAVCRGVLVGGLLATLVASVLAPDAAALAGRRPRPAIPVKAPLVVLEEPCAESVFTCFTIRVPRDHFTPGGPTIDVSFAVHRALATVRTGVLVIATGGPGTSGIAAADRYMALLDGRIARDYDIVFFDQRGIGRSLPFQCPDAALAFATSQHVPTLGSAEALAYADDAKAFAGSCVVESGIDPELLPFLSTRQAVEDLEAFRVLLRADRLDLYGESYGTQYAQTYARAHPSRLRSLVLDGPVDLTLTGSAYYDEGAEALDEVLSMVLDRCAGDAVCRRDVAGPDGAAGYDELASALRDAPLPYSFVDANGHAQDRAFELGDLETAVAGYVGTESDRMLLQRAIAWASRGDLLPLARLAYLARGQDPERQTAIADPAWSEALYYGVECLDYAYGSGTGEQRTRAYIAAAASAEVADDRVGSVFYGDLPCAWWPAHPVAADRPDYLTSTPYPVFLLASTTDPATPYAGALRIMSHLKDGYLIVRPGGPHISFGRGRDCPDDTITAFLVDGVLPGTRFVTCDFTGTDPYIPNPAATVADYRDALAAMTAVDAEINLSPDLWRWDRKGPLTVGCHFGGSMEYTASRNGYTARLDDCVISDGLALTGTASIDTTRATFAMKVTGPGATSLTYGRDARARTSVTGSWFGAQTALSGQLVLRPRR